jgi:tRNA-2-methylthio-N6-dimethylallyladenosine synthase
MPSVFIKTYGCQMNERDSEQVAAQLVAKGYSLADSENSADVVLLNTCSVRDAAEQKAIGKMRELSVYLGRSRPNVVLGFLGCMAQSRGQELADSLPKVNLVIGTQQFHHTADFLDDILAQRRKKIVAIEEESGSQSAIKEHVSKPVESVGAFVSIMQGCNQCCTFCIVPFTRGAERSRSIGDVVAECRELVARGAKEITLLGQIVTSYGRREIKERDGKTPFVQLLEAVQEIEGLERIRFTSPHPKGYGDDLVEAYGRLSKLVENAHIPVQSGSNNILKAMHRGYTRERFLEIIGKLRRVQPGMGISTDLIVGFPGETEQDFEDTLSLVRESRFDNAFIFKYSIRKDTPAAVLPEQLPQEVKEERHRRLLTLINELGAANYQACAGRRMQALVEGPSKRNAARLTGRTRCGKIVIMEADELQRGQVVELNITRAGAFTLYGQRE